MTYSKDGLHLTEQFEGCRLHAYQDSGGVWTIGYGHTHDVNQWSTCDEARAQGWLLEDITSAAHEVNRLVRVPLTQLEYDALVDFQFNTGALSKGEKDCTLLRLLNAGDYHGAAAQFERWDKVKGVELAGLLKRRKAEEAEFSRDLRTGQNRPIV
jgi:lysozyme